MCLSAVLGVGSALIGGASASKAAKAQKQAADAQVALQREIYDDTTQRFEPFYDNGLLALKAYLYEMGLGPAPTIGGQPLEITEISETIPGQGHWEYRDTDGGNDIKRWIGSADTTQTRYNVNGQLFDTREAAETYANANKTGGTTYGGYTKTPGYDFRLNQGLDAVEASRAAGSGLLSGRTLRDLTQYGQDYATSEYTSHLNRLAGLSDSGQASAGNMANAGTNYASGASNALSNKGNALAAGAIGVGNSIQNGINTGIGIYQYQQGLNTGTTNGTAGSGIW